MARNEENVLYLVWSPFEDVAHAVGAATVAVAKAADDAPVLIAQGYTVVGD
jgi:hypothetical protein